MANVTLDIDALTASLKEATRSSLPWTTLQSTNYTLNESTPPAITDYSEPQVMASASFVPAIEFSWKYKEARQVIVEYVMQRDTSWRTGRIRIFHDMDIVALALQNEPTQPQLPSPYVPHTLYVSHNLDLNIGDCGVTLSAAHYSEDGTDEKFGITFQITNALPAVFPKLAATYVSVIPVW